MSLVFVLLFSASSFLSRFEEQSKEKYWRDAGTSVMLIFTTTVYIPIDTMHREGWNGEDLWIRSVSVTKTAC